MGECVIVTGVDVESHFFRGLVKFVRDVGSDWGIRNKMELLDLCDSVYCVKIEELPPEDNSTQKYRVTFKDDGEYMLFLLRWA